MMIGVIEHALGGPGPEDHDHGEQVVLRVDEGPVISAIIITERSNNDMCTISSDVFINVILLSFSYR